MIIQEEFTLPAFVYSTDFWQAAAAVFGIITVLVVGAYRYIKRSTVTVHVHKVKYEFPPNLEKLFDSVRTLALYQADLQEYLKPEPREISATRTSAIEKLGLVDANWKALELGGGISAPTYSLSTYWKVTAQNDGSAPTKITINIPDCTFVISTTPGFNNVVLTDSEIVLDSVMPGKIVEIEAWGRYAAATGVKAFYTSGRARIIHYTEVTKKVENRYEGFIFVLLWIVLYWGYQLLKAALKFFAE